MKIKYIIDQHRRDFNAIIECEHCGDTIAINGYDDDNFHANVIPNIICKACGNTAPENYRPLKTKYESWEII